jgi:hypothetical protein
MSQRRSEMDDERLDLAIEEMARIEAPSGLTARVRASLDAADERHASGLVFGRRPGWALALSTAALVLIAAGWWLWPVAAPTVVGPNFSSARAPAPVVGPTVVGPTVVGPNFSSARSAISSVSSAPRTRRPVRRPDDHERALPSLAALPAVQQDPIDPLSLSMPALALAPTLAIRPLTIDTDWRDERSRGASR